MESGIKQLVKSGATNIKVIPMFLFDGVHVTEDIPQEIESLMVKYPGIRIKIGRHIGDDDRMADILVDRINSID